MKPMTSEEIKSVERGLLRHFAEYCDKNSIRYCLAYGTLLGAIRHKGFIPWDDDIDVFVPRNDYDKLLESYNLDNKSNNTRMMYFPYCKDYFLPFAKIVDVRTRIIEREAKVYSDAGIYIDIFPIDGFGDELTIAESRFQRLKKMLLREYAYIYNKQTSFQFKSCLLWVYQHIISFKKHMSIEISYTHKYDYDKSKYVAVWAGPYRFEKEMFERAVLDDTIIVPFEDGYYKVPKNYHKYLTQMYGDYMKFPPENERCSPHSFDAFWR